MLFPPHHEINRKTCYLWQIIFSDSLLTKQEKIKYEGRSQGIHITFSSALSIALRQAYSDLSVW